MNHKSIKRAAMDVCEQLRVCLRSVKTVPSEGCVVVKILRGNAETGLAIERAIAYELPTDIRVVVQWQEEIDERGTMRTVERQSKPVDRHGREMRAGDLLSCRCMTMRARSNWFNHGTSEWITSVDDGCWVWEPRTVSSFEILARGLPSDPVPESFEPERDGEGRPVLEWTIPLVGNWQIGISAKDVAKSIERELKKATDRRVAQGLSQPCNECRGRFRINPCKTCGGRAPGDAEIIGAKDDIERMAAATGQSASAVREAARDVMRLGGRTKPSCARCGCLAQRAGGLCICCDKLESMPHCDGCGARADDLSDATVRGKPGQLCGRCAERCKYPMFMNLECASCKGWGFHGDTPRPSNTCLVCMGSGKQQPSMGPGHVFAEITFGKAGPGDTVVHSTGPAPDLHSRYLAFDKRVRDILAEIAPDAPIVTDMLPATAERAASMLIDFGAGFFHLTYAVPLTAEYEPKLEKEFCEALRSYLVQTHPMVRL